MKTKIILSALVLAVMMLGVIGVVSGGLPTTVIVGDEEITFNLQPETLSFGTIVPGETGNSIAPITFQVTSGNVDVTLAVTDITGDAPLKNIKSRDTDDLEGVWTDLKGKSGTVLCAPVDDICTYPTTLSWDATLTIDPKVVPKTYNGVIVYTINGVAPA